MKKYKTIQLDTGVRVTQHTINGITYVTVITENQTNATQSPKFTIIKILAITAILLTIAVFTAQLFFKP